MKLTKRFFTGHYVLLILGVVTAPGRASAQNVPETHQEIEEIVVTAQKRDERLQDVPIAITAITGASAAARGVTDTQALQDVVPGLSFPKIGTAITPFIRGIGASVLEQGDTNSVAIYVDGILEQSPTGANFSLNNIERIEVLKGPQGTLFGRNADGGVISVTTRTPSQTTALDASVSYGNFESTAANFYFTTGIVDNLAMDLSLNVDDQQEGWGHNLFTGLETYKSNDLSIRSKWLWTPSDQTTVTLAGSRWRSAINDNSYHIVPGDVGPDGSTFPGFYNVNVNDPNTVGEWGWDVNLQAKQDLGWADLVSLTSYSNLISDRPGDSDETPVNFQEGLTVDQFDRGVTQELQLRSADSSKVKWVAGVYYLDATSGYREPDAVTVTGSSLGGLAFLRLHGQQVSTSYAAFTQATIPIVSKLRLTLGTRYTGDKQAVQRSEELPPPIGDLGQDNESAKFHKLDYKVTLDYAFTNDVMGYVTNSTGYKAGLFNVLSPGQAAVKPEELKAYEAGLKTTLFERRLQVNAAGYYYDYKDIQVNAFQGSANGGAAVTEFLNAAKARIQGFDFDFTAVPINHLTLQGGGAYVDAKYTSFPGAPFFVQTFGPDGRILGGRDQVPGDAAGNRLVRAPKIQWSLGGEYEIPAGQGFIKVSGNFNHQGVFYWDFANVFREPAHDMVSATLAWAPSERWQISLWGKNLLNEQYAIAGLASGFGFSEIPGAPRTYGVRFSVKM